MHNIKIKTMSTKEYNTLKDFIKGQSKESVRKSVTEKIKSYQKIKQAEMKNDTHNTDFNTDNAWNSLHNRIEENGLSPEERKKIFNLSPALRIAASLILIVGLSFSAFYIFNSNKYVELASLNEISEHKLPDGTVVTLNKYSNMKYPKSFKGDIREVDFSGEAYFNVTENPEKPFIINTNGAEVKVLGTSFNLRSNNNENVILTVASGKVQLAKKSDPAQKLILLAGDIGTIDNEQISSNTNNDVNYLSWKTKNLYFKQGENLKNVIFDLNKTYDVKIVFEDDNIGNEKINEHPFKNRELSFILDLFCELHNLEHKTVGDKIIISKK